MSLTLPLFVLAARVTLADGPAPVRMMLLVHVLAGAAALVTGYLALYAAKGSTLHRKSGIGFVYSMVTMGLFGVVINLFEGEEWTDGLVVAYFVISALTTVRPPTEQRRWRARSKGSRCPTLDWRVGCERWTCSSPPPARRATS